jgi:Leucine-rich repeat (LRR) protein
MKHIIILFLFLSICFSVAAQNTGNDAASIRAQMSAIRKSTNWSDAAAAKAANAKIQELSAKLTSALRQGKPQTMPPGSEGIKPEEAAKIQQDNDDYSNKLWNQMMKIVQEGGKGKWDLAEPLREEIVEEYKEDENPAIKNAEWLKSMSYLLINFSFPQVQVIIDQMPNFKGIKTLIITTEKPVVAPDLTQILKNAKDYPLEELYVINFGPTLTSIPSSVADFPNLKILAIYNNGIGSLPSVVSKLSSLSSLQIQDNPINTLQPVIASLKNLKELGLVKTKLTENEINQIQKSLPECNITRP